MGKIFKTVMSVVLMGAMVLCSAACAKEEKKIGAEKLTANQFQETLKKANVGIFDQDISKVENNTYSYVKYQKGDDFRIFVEFWRYEEGNAPIATLATKTENYKKLMQTGSFTGIINNKKTGGVTYFTTNGFNNDEHDLWGAKGYYYGGWYFTDRTIIIVYTKSDTDEYRIAVDKIITQLGFPKPERPKR